MASGKRLTAINERLTANGRRRKGFGSSSSKLKTERKERGAKGEELKTDGLKGGKLKELKAEG